MRELRSLAAILAITTLLSGCGSMLAAMDSGPIEDDVTERTMAQRLEDESIETKAIVNVSASDDAYDDAHLVAVSYNGYVLLAGQVPTQALKDNATQVLRDIEGVRRIYNELEIGSPTSRSVRTKDTWLTTQVKSALLFRGDTPGGRVKVVTENSVVYLMGLLTAEEADRAAAVARGVEDVASVVKLFEVIDPT